MKRYLMIGAALSLVLLGGCAAVGQEAGHGANSSPEAEISQPLTEHGSTLDREDKQPKQTQLIGYEYQYANMQVALPEGWAWSVTEYTPDCFRFGISFWPEEAESGKVDLFYYPGGFGVCGTGLSQEDIRFESGLGAVVGTYDNAAIWDYVSFRNTPGFYVAHTDGVNEWWYDYADQVMDILGSAVLGQGSLTEGEALELARQACTMDYTREYAEFDFESGQWLIRYRGKDAQSIWEIRLDNQGNEIAQLCGLPKAPEEGTA